MSRKEDTETVEEFCQAYQLTADPHKPFDKKAMDAFLQAAWPVVEEAFYRMPPDKQMYYFTKWMEWKVPKLATVQFEAVSATETTIDLLRQRYGGAYVKPKNTIES